MAFQAPRIVGGGQIVSRPNTYQDPGSRMVDAYNQGADRNLKKKALELEAKNLYADMDVATPGEGHVPFEEWYGGDQQGGGGGLLGMVKGMFPGKGGSQQTSGLPFDPDDPASVKKYQADNGLTVDGVVGPKTMDKAKQTSFQAPDRPSPLNPDYQVVLKLEYRKLLNQNTRNNYMVELHKDKILMLVLILLIIKKKNSGKEDHLLNLVQCKELVTG